MRTKVSILVIVPIILMTVFVVEMGYRNIHADSRKVNMIKDVKVATLFEDRKCVFMFRVDDLNPCKKPQKSKRGWYDPYLFSNITRKWRVKTVWGVITAGGPKYVGRIPSCANNTQFYNYLRKLAVFDEIASHSRWHLNTRQRARLKLVKDDILGSYFDLAKRGFKVLTFIWPYGDSNPAQAKVAHEKFLILMGVNKMSPEKILRALLDAPHRIAVPVKTELKGNSNLKTLLGHIEYCIKHGGAIIVFTHPHSFNFNTPQKAMTVLNELFSALDKMRDRLWFATPGEVLSYHLFAMHTNVEVVNSTTIKVEISNFTWSSKLFQVPLTLKVILSKEPRKVYYDNHELKKLDRLPSDIGFRDDLNIGWYLEKGDKDFILIVNIPSEVGEHTLRLVFRS